MMGGLVVVSSGGGGGWGGLVEGEGEDGGEGYGLSCVYET